MYIRTSPSFLLTQNAFSTAQDKAALLNSGRLMDRRVAREVEEANAEIATLRNQLEEAQKEATLSKGGDGAIKELQKQIAELRAEASLTEPTSTVRMNR